MSIDTPVRVDAGYDERINGNDRGLINAWEVGRKLAQRDADLVARVKNGELPPLGIKGGVEKAIKNGKIGSLWYLAKWHGLRGDDLDIDVDSEVLMTCSATGVEVLFTLDFEKLRGVT